MRTPTKNLSVGVIVNNVGGYSRGVIRGITSYANARAWTCRLQGVNGLHVFGRLKDFDGLIVQAATPQQVRSLAAAGTPVVNVSSALPAGRFPSVVSDDVAVGRTGADYFIRRGHRHFVFYAPDDRRFVKLRHSGFAARVRESGFDSSLATDEATLTSLLAVGEKPIAVMGCNDGAALAALELCRERHWKVPDHVAVLGVDNDELVQSLAYPPLSTVNTARQRIGFEAAAMLEAMMSGRTDPAPPPTLVPPTGVITRQSTDLLAIDDSGVADAMRFIHAHAGRPIGVEHVLSEVPLSRRQLERRFRAALGRSILDEILRCRIDRAKGLLVDTELALPQVATASGFASASYLSVVFRKAVAMTPGAYRERFTMKA
ncbi:MAG TPA: substrate-binding domain-containing protein [Tepidisphaeraceae bacterium]|jgi:LacI family transcriptional regulator